MDTLNVWRALWRNRWVALPVVALTVLGVCWVLFVRPATYQVQSSVLLLPPPPAPSAQQIDQDPALGRLNADNPYGRSYDPTILIALVSNAITSDPSREKIEKAGGDGRFTVVQTTKYGTGSPFADITSVAGSVEEAIASNELVIAAFQADLARLQAREKVSPRYLITARVAGEPTGGQVRATDIGRLLIGFVGLGIVGLFGAVSVSDALRLLRAEQAEQAAQTERAARAEQAGPPGSAAPDDERDRRLGASSSV